MARVKKYYPKNVEKLTLIDIIYLEIGFRIFGPSDFTLNFVETNNNFAFVDLIELKTVIFVPWMNFYRFNSIFTIIFVFKILFFKVVRLLHTKILLYGIKIEVSSLLSPYCKIHFQV